jgi:uncharacterized protein
MLVEVVFAGQEKVLQRFVEVDAGATVKIALEKSAILEDIPEFQVNDGNIGIFSRKVGLEHKLEENDRIELYRQLTLTPNEIRKRKAERKSSKL